MVGTMNMKRFIVIVRKNRIEITGFTAWVLLILVSQFAFDRVGFFADSGARLILIAAVWLPLVWVVGGFVLSGVNFERSLDAEIKRQRSIRDVVQGYNEILREKL